MVLALVVGIGHFTAGSLGLVLENLSVFVFVGVLVASYRAFSFSNLSYVLITLFLTLHTIGAHYAYSKVPVGFWLQAALSLNRNRFDVSRISLSACCSVIP